MSRGVIIAMLMAVLSPMTGHSNEEKTRVVIRRGVFMGLDPGLALRFGGAQRPIYTRLALRLGGCLTPKLLLGVDWRIDIFTGNAKRAVQRRHTIGPVLTAFLFQGIFLRPYIHLGGISPIYTSIGLQTGYEFSFGRLGALGVAVGGDADIPFNGQPPLGYTVFALFYLTAYDLRNRRNRD